MARRLPHHGLAVATVAAWGVRRINLGGLAGIALGSVTAAAKEIAGQETSPLPRRPR